MCIFFSTVHSAYDYTIKAHGKELVKTDIQIKLPQGTYGRIAPRSGLAWKNFIDVGGTYSFVNVYIIWADFFMVLFASYLAGVIDEDYRGNVGVLLFNHSDEDFTVKRGDRVAQLICQKIAYPEVKEFKVLFVLLIELTVRPIFLTLI